MTQDIKGLNVNQELAETVKKEFGLNIANTNTLEITTHSTEQQTGSKDIYPILGARVQELGNIPC